VASGKILMVKEHILKRKKKTEEDMKKKPKSSSKIKVNNFSI
jgi:hypothetical protein